MHQWGKTNPQSCAPRLWTFSSFSGSWSEHPRELCDHRHLRAGGLGTQAPLLSSLNFWPYPSTWNCSQRYFAGGVTQRNLLALLGLKQGFSQVNAGLEAEVCLTLSTCLQFVHLHKQKGLTPAHPTAWRFRGFLGPPEAMALCKSCQTLSLLMAVKLCSLFTSVTEIRVSPLIHWLIEDYLTCHGAKRQPRDFDSPADPGWFCITRLSAGLWIQPVTHNVLQTISSSLPASAEWPEVSLIGDLAYSYHNGSM